MRLLVIHHQCPGQYGHFGHFVRRWGIATEILRPDARATVATPSSVALKAGDPVAACAARNLEPCRGFHTSMRARRCNQQTDPRCHALSVRGEEDEASHGVRPSGGAATWREKMLSEARLDPARTRLRGRIARASCVNVQHVSAAHFCLPCPFVLSASLLEAVAYGAPPVASDTAPVSEAIREGVSL